MGWNGIEFTLPTFGQLEADRRQRYNHAIGNNINYPHTEYKWQRGGQYSNRLTEKEIKIAQNYVSKLIEEYEKIGWGNLCVYKAEQKLRGKLC